MYHVYILYSRSSDTYYTGYTSLKPEKRLERHNEGWSRSTKHGIPWELKHTEPFESKSEAIKRENHIKRQKSRKYIEELIAKGNNKTYR